MAKKGFISFDRTHLADISDKFLEEHKRERLEGLNNLIPSVAISGDFIYNLKGNRKIELLRLIDA